MLRIWSDEQLVYPKDLSRVKLRALIAFFAWLVGRDGEARPSAFTG